MAIPYVPFEIVTPCTNVGTEWALIRTGCFFSCSWFWSLFTGQCLLRHNNSGFLFLWVKWIFHQEYGGGYSVLGFWSGRKKRGLGIDNFSSARTYSSNLKLHEFRRIKQKTQSSAWSWPCISFMCALSPMWSKLEPHWWQFSNRSLSQAMGVCSNCWESWIWSWNCIQMCCANFTLFWSSNVDSIWYSQLEQTLFDTNSLVGIWKDGEIVSGTILRPAQGHIPEILPVRSIKFHVSGWRIVRCPRWSFDLRSIVDICLSRNPKPLSRNMHWWPSYRRVNARRKYCLGFKM